MRVWYPIKFNWYLGEARRSCDVDGFVTHPDGKTFFRVNDHWFPADMCELVE